MHAQKLIEVHVEQEVLEVLIDNKFNLCVAFSVDEIVNVVALVIDPKPIITIQWKETYWMAATDQKYVEGKVVRAASSTRRSVKLGDKYFLPDWKTSKVGHDGKVSADELGFFNGVMAAPIIFLDAGADEPTPIFITKILPPKINSDYRPSSIATIWFASSEDFEAATMFDSTKIDNPHTIDLSTSDSPSMKTSYTKTGEWVDDLIEMPGPVVGKSSMMLAQINAPAPIHMFTSSLVSSPLPTPGEPLGDAVKEEAMTPLLRSSLTPSPNDKFTVQ